GFSRYSVDHKWHIPHFEKMLYDNAQLLVTYTNAYIDTKNELFKEVVQKTVSFILNNWQDPSGGFYTAYDADSLNSNNKLEEGAYYFWTKAELEQLISEDEWKLFAAVFSINSDGFWEEANAYVLFQKDDLKTIAKKYNVDVDQLKTLKTKWEDILLKNREQRTKPLLDDKIIISWNAQLLSGFLSARKIISSTELNTAIENLTTFLQFKAYKNDNLGRIYKNNQNYISGNLEDYAFTIKSFLELFNETQDLQHLKFAQNLTFQALDLFFNIEQGFFKSSKNETIGTVFEIEDNVIPSANAIMARNLFYVGFLFKNDYFMQLSQEMTNRILGQINYASAYSEWLTNNLIFKDDFEYIVLKEVSKEESTIINQKNAFKIILDNSLNIPILNDYKNQDKKFQVCNINSCRLATNEIKNI
ncbi:MAG: thioredoxin domain-containing protein, partial [Myroides sp.]